MGTRKDEHRTTTPTSGARNLTYSNMENMSNVFPSGWHSLLPCDHGLHFVTSTYHLKIQSINQSRIMTRDGTAEPVSRDQILRRERGQGSISFPCSANPSKIGSLTRLIHTLAICVTIHTSIHTSIHPYIHPSIHIYIHTYTHTYFVTSIIIDPPLGGSIRVA